MRVTRSVFELDAQELEQLRLLVSEAVERKRQASLLMDEHDDIIAMAAEHLNVQKGTMTKLIRVMMDPEIVMLASEYEKLAGLLVGK